MPVRFPDVSLYLIAAAIPLVLLALSGVFRWRYLRAVERAIHAPAPAPHLGSEPSPRGLSHQPLILVNEHPAAGRIPAGPGLLVARREEAAYRTALALSGLLFVALAPLLIWWGYRNLGARAVSFAYWCTLPGLLLIAVFVRRAWIAAIGAVTIWLAAGLLLHLVGLRLSVSSTLHLLGGYIGLVGPLTLMVGLLSLRATRPVLVGLVPLFVVWLVMAVAWSAALDAFGITLKAGDVTARAIAGGLLATALGIGLAVWQIRRGLRKGALVLSIGLTLGGALLGSVDGLSLASGIVSGIGFNGLVAVATWWLFERFVHFRASGHLPDEVLHYGFGWLALASFLPRYTGPVAWQFSVLPFVAFGMTLLPLLRRLRQRAATRVPGRLLLLRPFSDGRLRSHLLDALDNSWRRIGTLDLVVGGDLAVRTVSGSVLESMLLGTVRRHFLHRVDEVDDRLAKLPHEAALDGRFPLNEVHCDPAVWQAAVTALADRADVVVMDLRGMGAGNRGALFELKMVVQRVELSRIVLLADTRTDERALAEAAEEAWRAWPGVSSQIDADRRLVVLRCTGRVARDNPWIIEKVFAAYEKRASGDWIPARQR